jgi:O-antigen ligase
MPALTAYRVAELFAGGTIVLFLFGMSTDPYGDLLRLLYLCALACAADALLASYRSGVWPDRLFGALRSNQGGGVASSFLVFALFAKGFRPRTRVFSSATAVVALVLFGSLTSCVALLAGILTGCALAVRHRMVSTSLVCLLLSVTVVALRDVTFSDLTGQVGALLDRPSESIQTGTGRLSLWQETLKASAGRPFGSGYVAAERLMTLRGDVNKSLVWQAASSHNGFLSAWMGAGYIGLVVLCAYLIALWRTLSVAGGPNAGTLRTMLAVLMITNFSISSVGGRLDAVSVVAFALAALPTAGACAGSWAPARSMWCRR